MTLQTTFLSDFKLQIKKLLIQDLKIMSFEINNMINLNL